jgi:hypothetical protein
MASRTDPTENADERRVLTEEQWEEFEASTIKLTARELWESDRAAERWIRRSRGLPVLQPDTTDDLWADGN